MYLYYGNKRYFERSGLISHLPIDSNVHKHTIIIAHCILHTTLAFCIVLSRAQLLATRDSACATAPDILFSCSVVDRLSLSLFLRLNLFCSLLFLSITSPTKWNGTLKWHLSSATSHSQHSHIISYHFISFWIVLIIVLWIEILLSSIWCWNCIAGMTIARYIAGLVSMAIVHSVVGKGANGVCSMF